MFDMSKENLTKLGIAGAMLFAAYKYSKNPVVRASAVSIGAVIVAKQIPYVKDVV